MANSSHCSLLLDKNESGQWSQESVGNMDSMEKSHVSICHGVLGVMGILISVDILGGKSCLEKIQSRCDAHMHIPVRQTAVHGCDLDNVV
eukprot:7862117-Ditylum_brightwellii.AAC.2